jgi:ribose transport system substrate-binding protein
MSHPARQHRVVARCAAAAGIALSAFAVAACGSTSSSSAGGSSTKSAAASTTPPSSTGTGFAALRSDLAAHSSPMTSYPTVTPIAHGVSSLKGKTVWWVPIGASIPTLAAMGDAMQSALAHVGVKLQICDGKLLPTAIAACLSQAGSQGSAGVVTGFVDYASMPNSFNSLVAHRVPVLVAGEEPDGGRTSNAQLAFYPTRSADDEMQRLDIESAITSSNGKAKILYVGVTDSPETKQEAAYTKAFVAQHCPGCTFTEINYDTAAINKLSSEVSAALLSNPDTTEVVCEVDACEPFATQGIQTAGYTNKVKLFSANGNLSSLQQIKGGNLLNTDIGISSTYFGWLFADGILRVLTGSQPVPSATVERVFTKSNVSGLALTPAAYATEAWYGSNSFEQQFLSAWGGK